MSRGPGRWQRVMLAVIAEYSVAPVAAVVADELSRDPTTAEVASARRAVKRLCLAGQCRAIYVRSCRACGGYGTELTGCFDCRAPVTAARQLAITPTDSLLRSDEPLGYLTARGPASWVSDPYFGNRNSAPLTADHAREVVDHIRATINSPQEGITP